MLQGIGFFYVLFTKINAQIIVIIKSLLMFSRQNNHFGNKFLFFIFKK